LPSSCARHRRLSAEDIVMRAAILALVAFLLIAIALPLAALFSKSFQDGDGRFVGSPTMSATSRPRRWLPRCGTASGSRPVHRDRRAARLLYAYGLTRTCLRAKGFFLAVALLPLFAPSLLSAISLIYIFGNQGFLKSWLLGGSVYGPIGIVLAQVFYCFPHALMILITALSLADGRLYEAAEAMGTPGGAFPHGDLPGVRYGLISACSSSSPWS
jgi:iron(III) transport system permease protein